MIQIHFKIENTDTQVFLLNATHKGKKLHLEIINFLLHLKWIYYFFFLNSFKFILKVPFSNLLLN